MLKAQPLILGLLAFAPTLMAIAPDSAPLPRELPPTSSKETDMTPPLEPDAQTPDRRSTMLPDKSTGQMTDREGRAGGASGPGAGFEERDRYVREASKKLDRWKEKIA